MLQMRNRLYDSVNYCAIFFWGGFMPFLEVLGYMAVGAVFATFWMRKMIPLRIIAILGNLLFLSYGPLNKLHSVSLLHASLLPLNSFRLYQAVELRRKIQEISATEFKVKSLLPFMDEYKVPQGKFLFHEGDHVDFIYYLSSGWIYLVELNKIIEPLVSLVKSEYLRLVVRESKVFCAKKTPYF